MNFLKFFDSKHGDSDGGASSAGRIKSTTAGESRQQAGEIDCGR
jgi:hypothetical protein